MAQLRKANAGTIEMLVNGKWVQANPKIKVPATKHILTGKRTTQSSGPLENVLGSRRRDIRNEGATAGEQAAARREPRARYDLETGKETTTYREIRPSESVGARAENVLEGKGSQLDQEYSSLQNTLSNPDMKGKARKQLQPGNKANEIQRLYERQFSKIYRDATSQLPPKDAAGYGDARKSAQANARSQILKLAQNPKGHQKLAGKYGVSPEVISQVSRDLLKEIHEDHDSPRSVPDPDDRTSKMFKGYRKGVNFESLGSDFGPGFENVSEYDTTQMSEGEYAQFQRNARQGIQTESHVDPEYGETGTPLRQKISSLGGPGGEIESGRARSVVQVPDTKGRPFEYDVLTQSGEQFKEETRHTQGGTKGREEVLLGRGGGGKSSLAKQIVNPGQVNVKRPGSLIARFAESNDPRAIQLSKKMMNKSLPSSVRKLALENVAAQDYERAITEGLPQSGLKHAEELGNLRLDQVSTVNPSGVDINILESLDDGEDLSSDVPYDADAKVQQIRGVVQEEIQGVSYDAPEQLDPKMEASKQKLRLGVEERIETGMGNVRKREKNARALIKAYVHGTPNRKKGSKKTSGELRETVKTLRQQKKNLVGYISGQGLLTEGIDIENLPYDVSDQTAEAGAESNKIQLKKEVSYSPETDKMETNITRDWEKMRNAPVKAQLPGSVSQAVAGYAQQTGKTSIPDYALTVQKQNVGLKRDPNPAEGADPSQQRNRRLTKKPPGKSTNLTEQFAGMSEEQYRSVERPSERKYSQGGSVEAKGKTERMRKVADLINVDKMKIDPSVRKWFVGGSKGLGIAGVGLTLGAAITEAASKNPVIKPADIVMTAGKQALGPRATQKVFGGGIPKAVTAAQRKYGQISATVKPFTPKYRAGSATPAQFSEEKKQRGGVTPYQSWINWFKSFNTGDDESILSPRLGQRRRRR
jgi:hypothetical protein